MSQWSDISGRSFTLKTNNISALDWFRCAYFLVHKGPYYNSESEMVSFPPDIPVLL